MKMTVLVLAKDSDAHGGMKIGSRLLSTIRQLDQFTLRRWRYCPIEQSCRAKVAFEALVSISFPPTAYFRPLESEEVTRSTVPDSGEGGNAETYAGKSFDNTDLARRIPDFLPYNSRQAEIQE